MSLRLGIALASAFVAVLLFELARSAVLRWRGTWRAKRRARRALRGEAAAAKLLTKAGYELLDEQLTCRWTVRLGEQERSITLRADYLVQAGDRTLVAEVKTGESAPDVGNAATRRQLLEYLVAYDADGVLLVDPERGAIDEVEFPLLDQRNIAEGEAPSATASMMLRVIWFAAGTGLGIGLATWFR